MQNFDFAQSILKNLRPNERVRIKQPTYRSIPQSYITQSSSARTKPYYLPNSKIINQSPSKVTSSVSSANTQLRLPEYTTNRTLIPQMRDQSVQTIIEVLSKETQTNSSELPLLIKFTPGMPPPPPPLPTVQQLNSRKPDTATNNNDTTKNDNLSTTENTPKRKNPMNKDRPAIKEDAVLQAKSNLRSVGNIKKPQTTSEPSPFEKVVLKRTGSMRT